MKEYKVAPEQAEKEFDNFVEAMDLDVDPAGMNEKDLQAFEKCKRTVLLAIQRGSLVFNGDGEAVFTPQRSEESNPITFHERTGASLMAMDTKGKDKEIAKAYAAMADMCHVPPKTFAKLKGTDIKVCEALFALLMD